MKKIEVCHQDLLNNGESRVVEMHDRQIAVFKIDDEFFAIDNSCPHRGAPLADGPLEGSVVTCIWHAWEYDVKTGESPGNPDNCVERFTCLIENETIFVEVPF